MQLLDSTVYRELLLVPPDTTVPKKRMTLKRLRKAQRLREEVRAVGVYCRTTLVLLSDTTHSYYCYNNHSSYCCTILVILPSRITLHRDLTTLSILTSTHYSHPLNATLLPSPQSTLTPLNPHPTQPSPTQPSTGIWRTGKSVHRASVGINQVVQSYLTLTLTLTLHLTLTLTLPLTLPLTLTLNLTLTLSLTLTLP